jgi:hypothetical protein
MSKINKTERAGGLAQVVEHLPIKHKSLCSAPSAAKNIQKSDRI